MSDRVSCKRCGATIPHNTTYVKALNATWHASCFVCAVCGRSIEGGSFRLTPDEKPCHARCYDAKFAKRCDICSGVIEGRYLSDYWGNDFHPEHKKELTHCEVCGRLICEPLTGGGRKYSDGRKICGICFDSAVMDQRVGGNLFLEARDFLQGVGLGLDGTTIQLQMTDIKTIRSKVSKWHSRSTSLALTETVTQTRNGRETGRVLKGIFLPYGLPETLFLSTAVHELTHAWLFIRRINPLPAKVEEGICGLMEFLYLKTRSDDLAGYLRHQLSHSQDPIYGKGFREALKFYRKHGLAKMMQHVKKRKKFSNGLFGLGL